jgi:fatty acid desaturase
MESISRAQYVQRFYGELPEEAFLPNHKEVWYFATNLGLLTTAYIALRSAPTYLLPIIATVIGHSMACIAFFAHDLSHGSVVRNKVARYLIELVAWGINFIPPRLWHIVHNRTHHRFANTHRDPDRRYTLEETTTSVRMYNTALYPHNRTLMRWNLLVFIQFVPYIIRNIASVFYSNARKPSIVPSKPAFTRKDQIVIGFELVVLVAIQVGLFQLMESSWTHYLFAGPLSFLITSAFVMMYVYTNHFISPFTEKCDPLLGTVSVKVPKLFNLLHRNFSFHTEHHLFPQMNPIHYPLVSDLLVKHFPDRYARLPLSTAWSRLWAEGPYALRQGIVAQPGAV